MRIIEDLKKYTQENNLIGVLFLSKGFHAMLAYRLGHFFAKIKLTPLAFLLNRVMQILYGIDIHWLAEIGGGCRIIHGYSLVISAGTKVGENCTLFHEVTLGVKSTWSNVGAPQLGKEVTVYAGAKILGPIKIADRVQIGANAVVVDNCEVSGSVYGGIPAKLLRNGHEKK